MMTFFSGNDQRGGGGSMYKREDRRVSENEGRHSGSPISARNSLATEASTTTSAPVPKSSEPEVYLTLHIHPYLRFTPNVV